jgi:hypothetical protein
MTQQFDDERMQIDNLTDALMREQERENAGMTEEERIAKRAELDDLADTLMREIEVLQEQRRGHFKGGRTARLEGRVTPLVKQYADEIKERTGQTVGDILEDAIRAIHQDIESSRHDQESAKLDIMICNIDASDSDYPEYRKTLIGTTLIETWIAPEDPSPYMMRVTKDGVVATIGYFGSAKILRNARDAQVTVARRESGHDGEVVWTSSRGIPMKDSLPAPKSTSFRLRDVIGIFKVSSFDFSTSRLFEKLECGHIKPMNRDSVGREIPAQIRRCYACIAGRPADTEDGIAAMYMGINKAAKEDAS